MASPPVTDRTRACPRCASPDAARRYAEPPFIVVRCRQCRLVYLQNPPSEDALYEEYYEPAPPSPDDYRVDSPNSSLRELYHINEQRVRVLQSLMSAGRILDVGCGRGYFLHSAGLAGYDTAGLEISEQASRFARDSFGLDVRTGSFDEVEPGGEKYNVVTLWHVLEHFLDPFEALRTIRSQLAPGGICLIEVPNLRSLKFQLSRTKWVGGNHPRYHRTFFTARTLDEALAEAGFAHRRRLNIPYRVPGHARAYTEVKRLLGALGRDAFLDFAASG